MDRASLGGPHVPSFALTRLRFMRVHRCFRSRHWFRRTGAGALAASLLALPGQLAAQLLAPSVTAVRGLAFGSLFPGVATTVQPSDPSRSARVDITGTLSSGIQITFGLPTTMTRSGGATVPLNFGSVSAAYSRGTSGAITSLFDPRAPHATTLSSGVLGLSGTGSVFLGAGVLPSGSQPAGAYSGTVSISVAYTSL